MTSKMKALASAVAMTALAFGVLSTAATAQVRVPRNPPIQGSVYGPYYNPHYQSNGTGTVTDWNRDPHNDR
jgi:hypothetical protein